jgi:hypothetical protein
VDSRVSEADAEISNIKARIAGIEDVNIQGLGLLQNMPQTLAANPTFVGAIATAAAEGTCRSSAPGACLSARIGAATDDIKDFLNTGGLAAGITAINLKVDALATAVTVSFGKTWAFLQLDRIVSLVTMAASVHNAIQLSDSIVQTFFSVLDDIFAIGNLMTGVDGTSINSRDAFNSEVESFFKAIFGVTEWEQIKVQWQLYNRIYQSSSNIVNEIRNISSNIVDAVQTSAQWTGDLGNAMLDEGLIGENNWSYKPEKVVLRGGILNKIDRLNNGLEVAQNVVSAIQQVTSSVRDIAESANQIKTESSEISKLITEATTASTAQREQLIEAETSPIPEFSWEDLL